MSNDVVNVMENEAGAVAGRLVSIPAKDYRQAFKSSISLGMCPLIKKENGDIMTCSAEFTGTKVLLAKGAMNVDVSRVQSSEDVMLHVMGGVGASVGVLGLVSASAKVNVAVTTETSKKHLNLMSSYEMDKGVLTLQNPKPKGIITDSALFLSEIALGGNELFLVTLEFESEKKKVDVQVTVTVKILFITITAKLRYIHKTFKSNAKVRIRFESSWRKRLDEHFSSLEQALPRVEEIENMYMEGSQILRDMSNDDERSHNFYYFSSWKQSPYGLNFNLAVINHDLNFLTDQNTEMQSVIHRIGSLSRGRNHERWSGDQRSELNRLNETLTEKVSQLTKGLDKYHTLSTSSRQTLRDIYGQDRAPLYYTRKLNSIIGE